MDGGNHDVQPQSVRDRVGPAWEPDQLRSTSTCTRVDRQISCSSASRVSSGGEPPVGQQSPGQGARWHGKRVTSAATSVSSSPRDQGDHNVPGAPDIKHIESTRAPRRAGRFGIAHEIGSQRLDPVDVLGRRGRRRSVLRRRAVRQREHRLERDRHLPRRARRRP